jgi:tetratricopeptide (TPR) repeat protein
VALEHGRRSGSASAFDDALAQFHRAADADSFDPQSRYEAAFTLLHLRRYREARELYERTEALAPGWFNCRADRYLAEKLERGEVDHALFAASVALQDGPLSATEKLRLADRTLVAAPRFAPLHLYKGKALLALNRAKEGQEAFREGLRESPDEDTETRLLVELATTLKAADAERLSLLEKAIDLGGNLPSASAARVLLRAVAS